MIRKINLQDKVVKGNVEKLREEKPEDVQRNANLESVKQNAVVNLEKDVVNYLILDNNNLINFQKILRLNT